MCKIYRKREHSAAVRLWAAIALGAGAAACSNAPSEVQGGAVAPTGGRESGVTITKASHALAVQRVPAQSAAAAAPAGAGERRAEATDESSALRELGTASDGGYFAYPVRQ